MPAEPRPVYGWERAPAAMGMFLTPTIGLHPSSELSSSPDTVFAENEPVTDRWVNVNFTPTPAVNVSVTVTNARLVAAGITRPTLASLFQ